MEISPDNMHFLDEQVALGKYTDRSEALDTAVELLRESQSIEEAVSSIDGLDAKLLEGVASPSSQMTQNDWQELKNRARTRWNEIRSNP